MSKKDIVAIMKQNYEKDLSNVWTRIQAYYASIGESAKLDGLTLDPAGNVEFYDSDYGIMLTNFTYEMNDPVYTPLIAFEQDFTNTTSVPDTMTPSFTRSEAATFSFGFNEGLKIGTKATVKVGIPLIAEGEAEVSGEISFGSSQQWTTTKTQTWTSSTTVVVPAHSSVTVVGMIKNAKSTGVFSGVARATSGNVLVWFKLATGGYTEWPLPLTVLLTKDQRTVAVSGSYSGIEGVLTEWTSRETTPAFA